MTKTSYDVIYIHIKYKLGIFHDRKSDGIMVKNKSRRIGSWKLDMKILGAGGAMFSAALYGLNALFATYAYRGGSNAIAFTFHSTAISVLVFGALMVRKKGSILPSKSMVPWLLLDGILGGVTTILLFSAFDMISTGIATVLHFTYPVYVAVLGIWILKKKLTKGKGIALALSLGGIVLTSDLSGGGAGLGMLLALLSGVTYAGYVLAMEKSGLQKADYIWFGFYMMLIRMLITLIYGGFTGNLTFSLTTTAWVMTVIHAVITGIVASILFQFGVRYAGGASASVFSMMEPVTCVVVGIAFLGESLNLVKLGGCVLIMAGILVVIQETTNE